MTDWHPSLGGADPAAAWFTPDKLARQRRADADESAFRAMLKRRRDFDLMLGDHPNEVSDEQRARAWQLAADEPWPDVMSDDEINEARGLAKHL